MLGNFLDLWKNCSIVFALRVVCHFEMAYLLVNVKHILWICISVLYKNGAKEESAFCIVFTEVDEKIAQYSNICKKTIKYTGITKNLIGPLRNMPETACTQSIEDNSGFKDVFQTEFEYFPVQWKVSDISLIPKPRKPLDKASSYRSISLLPILSKAFEKLLLNQLNPSSIVQRNLIWEIL